eukprot:1589379-Rhodomonas_salina.3
MLASRLVVRPFSLPTQIILTQNRTSRALSLVSAWSSPCECVEEHAVAEVVHLTEQLDPSLPDGPRVWGLESRRWGVGFGV